ncbi:Unknown protein, partial [Striga hermonthica]
EEVNNLPKSLLRDLAQPVIGPVTSCIRLGTTARNYELKTIHYNQLPSFHGLPNEDPLHFMREFYNVLQTFPLHGLNEDQLKMRCFPETLKDRVKAWLMTLDPNSLTTWEQVYTKFIGRYYSQVWERFKDLQRQCPHYNLPPALLMNGFYDSLHQNLQYMVDNAAGGDIWAGTAEEMMDIFEALSSNSSQKSSRGKRAVVNEASPRQDMMAHQIAKLTEQMRLMNARTMQPVQTMAVDTCGACGAQGHRSEVCPSAFDQDLGEQYANDLVTKKRKSGDGEKVVVYETASAMQHDLHKKERDPGGFMIKIALGNGKEASGKLDLGAGINLMPFSIFQRLGLGDLRPTRMCLQLADRSIRYPKGVVEDVLVRVGRLIVPVDFVVLDVGDVHENGKDHTILLGQPFMATTNTLIDVKNGTLNMTVLGESVSIYVREATSGPSANYVEECAFIDVSDPLIEERTIRDLEERLMPGLEEEKGSFIELME